MHTIKLIGIGVYGGKSRSVEVTKTTKTQVHTPEGKYSRKNGYPIGWDGWSCYRISDEDLEKLND